MVFGNVAPARGARSPNQRKQRILPELALAKEELDRLSDQLGPTQPSGAPERAELPILLFGQVELDTYHPMCMIHLNTSVKAVRSVGSGDQRGVASGAGAVSRWTVGRPRLRCSRHAWHGRARFQWCAPTQSLSNAKLGRRVALAALPPSFRLSIPCERTNAVAEPDTA
jgi:hypothetical protein